MRRDQSKLHQVWLAGSRLFFQPYISISGLFDSEDEFNRVYRDVASRRGALIADLVGLVPAKSEFYRDSSHYTARANRIVGQKVSRVLQESRQFVRRLEQMKRLSR